MMRHTKSRRQRQRFSNQTRLLALELLECRTLLTTGYGGAFAFFTDSTLTTSGLVGSYVNESLRAVDELDWRSTQAVSGTRVDSQVFFPESSLGDRSEVGITGGTDEDWDDFSVQWDGVVQIVEADTQLALRNEDGSRMWVDLDHNGVLGNAESELVKNGWGSGQPTVVSRPSLPIGPGTYAVRIQFESAGFGNSFSVIANPIQPMSTFAIYTDDSLSIPGLTGNYIDDNLRQVDELDWRVTQIVAGTRVDSVVDFTSNSWGVRSAVGLTGGTDDNWEDYSVQWDGVVQILEVGATLATSSDDGSRMWIDLDGDGVFGNSPEELIDNNWGSGQGVTTGPLSPSLQPGVYSIRIQYEEGGGGNFMQLVPGPAHVVRVAYVIPHNRLAQTSGVANLQEYLPRLQAWFREQMDRNGFGPKTFRYETQADGVTPQIHVVHVGVADDYIREDTWGHTNSSSAAAGASVWSVGEVWLLIPESHLQSPDGSVDGGTALGGSFGSGSDPGVAMMGGDTLFRLSSARLTDDQQYAGTVVPEIGPFPLVQDISFPWFEGDTFSSVSSSIQGATGHELTHAFGLGHDVRNDNNFHGNLMGNGLRGFRGALHPNQYPQDDTRLAYGAALALNVNRYFNSGASFTDVTLPTVSVTTSGTVLPTSGLLEIDFTAADNNGLAAALLRRNGDTIGEMELSGTGFSGSFVTPYYSTGANDDYQISVYDLQGNRQDANVSINVSSGLNRAPEPFVNVFHSNSQLGDTITLDASQTNDEDHENDSLLVEWDLNGDGTFDTAPSSAKTFEITPAQPGSFFVVARVTDAAGAQAVSAPIAVRVGGILPRVTEIRVGGSDWAPNFLAAVDPQRRLGYPIPLGSADQLAPLPWFNLDQVSITFNKDVNVSAEALAVHGTNTSTYPLADGDDSLVYDADTHTATWTFASPFDVDKLLVSLSDTVTDQSGLALDGEWTDGQSTASGNDTAGGVFNLRLNVLPGDVNQNQLVAAEDALTVIGKVISLPGFPAYSVFGDINGNALIAADDALLTIDRIISFLPAEEPTAAQAIEPTIPVVVRQDFAATYLAETEWDFDVDMLDISMTANQYGTVAAEPVVAAPSAADLSKIAAAVDGAFEETDETGVEIGSLWKWEDRLDAMAEGLSSLYM